MEKINEAFQALGELKVRIDGIVGLSFLLWESIAEGNFVITADTHGGAAYLLNKEITAIHDELHNIEDMLSDGLRDVSGLEPIGGHELAAIHSQSQKIGGGV